ncbi:alpha/beta hydrolase [uncultured Thalassospira sp.]|uniref:alpha/beta fold hydrolase n=1 Tax=uncultured Thalassospira sp. TaxID=404382 RepID=UPI00258EC181|nr:alpha/beta hydrolase [uncultured Thalassospira sp.]
MTVQSRPGKGTSSDLMDFTIDHFTAPDGVRLRIAIMTPPDTRGHVLILQGRGEFVERYRETANDLARRGYGTVTFDFRGHGGSSRATPDPMMGYVRDVAHYGADTRHVIDHVKHQHGITCETVMTHSTGGLVAMVMLLDQPDLWKSVVMIAPFFGLGGPRWFSIAAQILSGSLCRYGFDKQYLPGQRNLSPLAEFDPENILTSDPHRHDLNRTILQAAPDLVVGGTSAGWLDACFRAQSDTADRLAQPDMAQKLPPMTIILAGNDQVVSNRTTQDLLGHFPNVTIREIPEARHEILQERDLYRDQFWAAFDRHMELYGA